MRIVFFGTGKFSAVVLKGLVDNGYEVVAVVSQPDKVNGRNNKIIYSDIKKFCLDNNINIYQFEKLNKEGEEPLKALNPDIFVTASYGQIIKQNILDIPKYGTINVHASLLPKYRGPAPIQWAIMNGEKKTGVTIMKTDIGLDTGDIYFSKEIDIEDEDTSSSVFGKLAILGVDCLKEFFEKFDYYKNNHIQQNEAEATYFPMFKKEDFALSFDSNATNVCNKIKALENCFFIYKDMRFKVVFATVVKREGNPGEILSCNSKEGLIIACQTDAIKVEIIQPEGKQKMEAKAYMNANKFTKGDLIK